ncbi:MAG: CHAT domain-containing protein [Microcystis sp. M015S2]|nr:CHAT domain-containing protein [Microcystis sp. M025S2]MCA2741960.1 CHAT domain-containing protein [Microcystis sp. M015S2]MCA2757379.1 CHAT domain-containing protein [Microcystis sp. M145S2]
MYSKYDLSFLGVCVCIPCYISFSACLSPCQPSDELMINFHKNLQNDPDKAKALRQAMLNTMKKHENPGLWSAFVLFGEAEKPTNALD